MGEPSEHQAAVEAAEKMQRDYPHATDATYDRDRGKVVIHLSNGHELGLDPLAVQGLEHGDAQSLSEIEITPSGFGLHFPQLDADLYIPSLVEGIFGSRNWMARRMGQAGGRATSHAKAASSAANGWRGGRPRKNRLAGPSESDPDG